MDDFSTTCNSKVDRATHRRKEKKHCSPNDSDSSTVLEKTTEFFQICDIEGKGFVTRRDMQRLLKRFPLSADELENVFDMLDADGNGFLTSDEFSFGFSKFMGGPNVTPVVTCEDSVSVQSPGMLYSDDEDDEDRQFYTLMEKLGASNVFEDPEKVRSLWSQIRRKTPHLISFFEEILARVTYQIGKAHQEKKELETALKRKVATHDYEIQRLYEEMEQQIKNEKDRILLQDSERFLSRSQDLEDQLSVKEKELNILSSKHKQLERQYRELHSEQREIAVEKVKLKQYKEDLSCDLEHATRELNLAQEQLMMLQQQTSREREMEIYRVTESLQRERSSLLKQIDLLREMNKHLRDERDMCYQKPKTSGSNLSWTQKSESVTVKYSEHKLTAKSEEKDEEIVSRLKRKSVIGINGHSMDLEDVVDGRLSSKYQLRRIISIEEDHLPHLLQHGYQTQLRDWSEDEEPEEGIDLQMSNIYPTCSTPISEPAAQMSSLPREQPVGTELVQSDGVVSLFKIILVGNSSVGKTSLLRRFCEDSFVPGTCATVGIDYSVKTLTVDNRQVALQIWDTAGQERYRSITKQFFRKADGVVVVYDITSEQTFSAVREWLTSVQEGAGENVPIMLLGNKTDQDLQRRIPLGVGEKLAKDFHVIFYECSAFSAHNVTESMIHMARLLKEQEDRDKEKIVTLVDVSTKKKSCC